MATTKIRPIRLLMAEDDPEDQMLVRKAFENSHLANTLAIVNDGEELLDYLNHRPPFTDAPRPDLILLDLNMPRLDGREALAAIKQDPDLRSIPVIVLTTSSAEEDILRSYDLGVSSYIQKPVTFDKLREVVMTLGRYWFEIVTLPPHD
ncbi:MAG: response regulator [Lentisphaeria bacterium]|jgi:CheY-like chemotaxis protein